MSKFLEFFGFVSPEDIEDEAKEKEGGADAGDLAAESDAVGEVVLGEFDGVGDEGPLSAQPAEKSSFAFTPPEAESAESVAPSGEAAPEEPSDAEEPEAEEPETEKLEAEEPEPELAYVATEAPPREEALDARKEQPAYDPYEAPARDKAYEESLEQPAYEPYGAPVREVGGEPALGQPQSGEAAKGITAYTGASEEKETEAPKRTQSIISEDAYIDGNLTTSGNIEVQGGISGDVTAKGAVDIRGAIRGNVSGEKLGLYGCTVQGDMRATTGILVDAESMVIGNIRTKNIYLDGKLKGNIESDEISLLRSNAYYVGDIVTGSIAIEGGATISGNIKTFIEGDGDIEEPFRADAIFKAV
ncbi:MAG: polymer-forming cytoskeletal protein [Clostridiales Family XIII bacterium]|jgi:cytoskeletal protein CcmA (bactofilin family)|nr:polymer-forming cytoskeletal protein [Clostridiales Family XIII bacterium]